MRAAGGRARGRLGRVLAWAALVGATGCAEAAVDGLHDRALLDLRCGAALLVPVDEHHTVATGCGRALRYRKECRRAYRRWSCWWLPETLVFTLDPPLPAPP